MRTRRSMKHYTVFDSDFDSLATQELGQSVCITISSFCWAFGIDIFKDTMLAESVPEPTEAALGYIQPILLLFGIIFAIAAGAFWLKRRTTIQKIKDDCKVLDVEDQQPR